MEKFTLAKLAYASKVGFVANVKVTSAGPPPITEKPVLNEFPMKITRALFRGLTCILS